MTLQGRGDLDDQRWLDQQVATLGDGIEAARAIWLNWSDLRKVGRLHPGQSAGDFIAEQLGGVRLDLPRLIAALPAMSNRQIAAVAGVGKDTVRRERGGAFAPPEPDAEPARVIGADGKSYPGRVVREVTAEVIEPTEPMPEPALPELPAPFVPFAIAAPFWSRLLEVRDAIRDLSAVSPDVLAANVPARRRQQFARDLRRHGLVLGAIAARLEDMK